MPNLSKWKEWQYHPFIPLENPAPKLTAIYLVNVLSKREDGPISNSGAWHPTARLQSWWVSIPPIVTEVLLAIIRAPVEWSVRYAGIQICGFSQGWIELWS